MRLNVSGTFNSIHAGHEKLLGKTFSLGDEVVIGLTSDAYCKDHGKQAAPYAEREQALLAFLASKGWIAEIKPIDSVDGFAVDDASLEGIVVSEETKKNAEKINFKRQLKGLRPLVIISIPIVKSAGGKKISSQDKQ